ncbi:MAG: 2-polyprenyl-3-methyl-6-methoxy-1,4-benzoquinone monooxygenase [Burkholderiaceae bacterium]
MTQAADRFIGGFDRLLRAVFVPPLAARDMPRAQGPQDPLAAGEKRRSAGLMRVKHVGEVCAQGLYSGQAAATDNEALRASLLESGREEGDHLAWTAERLRELGSRPSLLNPVWYASSFAMGWLAGKAGDAVSLGFVVETEKQVEEHLATHLDTLPANDRASRAIVDAMRADEIRHGEKAVEAGAATLPPVIGSLMRGAAKVMTTTAYWI